MINQLFNLKLFEKILPYLSILILLASAPAQSSESDYFVFYSNSVNNHNAGEISFGLNDPAITLHEDACGVLLESVDFYAWYFYEANSSPAINSSTIYQDVKVFFPLPGCGSSNLVRVFVDDEEIFPNGDAADYIKLGDANSLSPIDSNGNVISNSTGGGHVGSGPSSLVDDVIEPDWWLVKGSIYQINHDMFDNNAQAKLAVPLKNTQQFLLDMQLSVETFISKRSRYHLGAEEKSATSYEDEVSLQLSNALRSLGACAKNYSRGNLEKAYIDCNIAKEKLEVANNYWDLLQHLIR